MARSPNRTQQQQNRLLAAWVRADASD